VPFGTARGDNSHGDNRVKTKAMTILLALAPIMACGSPAVADAPGAHVLASDNVASAPHAGLSGTSARVKRRAASGSETHGAARIALREHKRQTRQKARRHGHRPTGLAVHRGGANIAAKPAAGADARPAVEANATPVAKADAKAASDAMASVGADIIAEARRWIGTNPTGRARLWCARFMNFVLKRTGYTGTSSDMARSFASYGRRLTKPRVGAIVVLTRGRNGGHVGVVTGFDANGNPKIISGNHSRRVAEAVYPKGRAYAYVVPEK